MSWNKVAVVGAGLIKFGELFAQSYEQMAGGAFDAALVSVDKGLDQRRSTPPSWPPSGERCGARRASAATPCPAAIGHVRDPVTRVENACPSGSDAFRIGAMVVAPASTTWCS